MCARQSARRQLILAATGLAVLAFWPASATAQVGSTYRIGPSDKIAIRVLELPEFDDEFEVAEDGSLELPVLGRLAVEGLSERQLGEAIRRGLESEGMRRPTVTVRITDFLSSPVSVLGAVIEPGNQGYVPGRSSLLEVLLRAGGLASGSNQVIQVRRRAANGLSDQVSIRAADLFEIGDSAVNIPIFAGDIIHVPPARKIRVSFLGEVNNTGTVTFDSSEKATLLIAIARAGGLTSKASSKIRVIRGQGAGKTEITVNFRRVLSGKEPDPELEDGDLIVIKESFF